MTNKHLKKFNNKQAGVTLLLAILVLSSIMAISFSIATILFVEIRSSGDLLRTEPAYYAAAGVGEEAIFNVKRNVCGSNTCTYTNKFNNNVTASAPIQTSTSTPLFQDKITANTTFSTAKTYAFYDATAGINSTGGSNYGKVSVTLLNTGNSTQSQLHVYICQYDPTGGTIYKNPVCSSADDQGPPFYWLASNNILSLGGITSKSWSLDPNQQQELVLYNSDPQNSIYVSIETFDADGVTPKGLPYAGQTAVEVQTSNSSVGRTIRVLIPGGASATSIPLGNTASFIKVDSSTQGDWWSTYGTQGYNLITGANDTGNYSAIAVVTPSGQSYYDWGSTGPPPANDVRALVPYGVWPPAGQGFIHTWYGSPGPLSLDVNITDGKSHQLALYMVDWDSGGRVQTVQVVDGTTLATLDGPRTVSSFVGGQYYVWQVSGHVKINFGFVSGPNTVVSGIFFK